MSILIWIVYGFFVGILAKWLHPGEEPGGILVTIGIGIAGSYVGGFFNYLLGYGNNPLSTSGLLMGVVGAVVFLYLYSFLTKGK